MTATVRFLIWSEWFGPHHSLCLCLLEVPVSVTGRSYDRES